MYIFSKKAHIYFQHSLQKDENQLGRSGHSFGRLRINILSEDSGCASKLNAQLKENFIIRVHGNYILRDPSCCFVSAEGSENYEVEAQNLICDYLDDILLVGLGLIWYLVSNLVTWMSGLRI
ncbi:hypothetical protein CDAR_609601 [Caerostris darwini]|uniref:LAGLIDADG homing endonuclease n=1 Tax=Caerostris darwini TaxID=1538125 RepID=A0AAV4SBV9_9ARAC|nr:hypothetical protein CDAR_609601 [Caerostris darwini]